MEPREENVEMSTESTVEGRPKRTLENIEDELDNHQDKRLKEDLIYENPESIVDQVFRAFENGTKFIKVECKGKQEELNASQYTLSHGFKNILNPEDDVIIKRDKKLLIIAKSAESAGKAQAINKIDDTEVECRVYLNTCTSQYILKGVDKEISVKEIAEGLKEHKIHVHQVIRFKKRGENEPTKTVLIKELGNIKRDSVKCGSLIFRAHKFIEKPIICFRCLSFGHMQSNCKAEEPKCRNCGGNHDTQACIIDEPECFRCGSKNHSGIDIKCPIVKNESSIITKARRENISIKKARKEVDAKKSYADAIKSSTKVSSEAQPVAGNEKISTDQKELYKSINELREEVKDLKEITLSLLATQKECTPILKSNHSIIEGMEDGIAKVITTKVVDPIAQVNRAVDHLFKSLERYLRESINKEEIEEKITEDQVISEPQGPISEYPHYFQWVTNPKAGSKPEPNSQADKERKEWMKRFGHLMRPSAPNNK